MPQCFSFFLDKTVSLVRLHALHDTCHLIKMLYVLYILVSNCRTRVNALVSYIDWLEFRSTVHMSVSENSFPALRCDRCTYRMPNDVSVSRNCALENSGTLSARE